jgi:phosphonate transport system permease protein
VPRERPGGDADHEASPGVQPSLIPQFTSLFLCRIDVSARDSPVLGVVGAGGIGFYIDQAIDEFQFSVMLTCVLMVMVMVIALDLLSAWLRRRIAR